MPQIPASSRLKPIRAAKETTNRTAARVKVGVIGATTGAATSVGCMMNTFDEGSELWRSAGVVGLNPAAWAAGYGRSPGGCLSPASHIASLDAPDLPLRAALPEDQNSLR